MVDVQRPKLLVACPPCTHWGGWYHLNQQHLTLLQRLHNKRVAQKTGRLCDSASEETDPTGR